MGRQAAKMAPSPSNMVQVKKRLFRSSSVSVSSGASASYGMLQYVAVRKNRM